MSDYKPGEVVDITITGARLSAAHAQPPSLDHLGILVDERYLRVPLGPSVTVTRRVPAEGIKVGDVWRDGDGDLWLASLVDNDEDALDAYIRMQATRFSKQPHWSFDSPEEVHRAYELAELVHRDEPDPQAIEFRERLRTTPFGDEPGTVPIGGVSPGAIVSYAEWNQGGPVRAEIIEEAGENFDEVTVFWRNREHPSHTGRYTVPADTQVTLVEVSE